MRNANDVNQILGSMREAMQEGLGDDVMSVLRMNADLEAENACMYAGNPQQCMQIKQRQSARVFGN